MDRYPIYAIPSHIDEKELAACFLTYHTLSSSFQGILKSVGVLAIYFRSALKWVGSSKFKTTTSFVSADCISKYDEIDLEKDKSCFEEWGSLVGEKCKKKNNDFISLSPFGLVTCKMQRSVWLNSSFDNERISDMHNAADSWLKQLNVNHNDFNFFTNQVPFLYCQKKVPFL